MILIQGENSADRVDGSGEITPDVGLDITSDNCISNKAVTNQLTSSDGLTFKFATDGEGNYGYLGADDSFIPFRKEQRINMSKSVGMTWGQPIKAAGLAWLTVNAYGNGLGDTGSGWIKKNGVTQVSFSMSSGSSSSTKIINAEPGDVFTHGGGGSSHSESVTIRPYECKEN